ncbi:MAG: ATP-binding domain-containing protein [Candidatus Methanofastidiosa archaeon]|nr:ATP-binding domain-containing protein [Candidatus Methanofastidiosa archaeon]
MYESLGENELEAHPSDNWSFDDGEIKLFISSDEKAEAERIVPDIVKKISIGVKVDDICILVKQTAEKYSAEIITLLKSYGVRARIENDFQDSLKQSVVLLILNIFKVSLKIQTADEWENLENFWLKITGLAEGIGGHTFDSVQTELNELIYYCQNRLNDISDKNDFVVLVQEIIKKLEVERICRAFPEYEQGNYLVTVLNIFVDLFWKEYNLIDGFKVAIEKFQGENTIPIMTIHKSKGLEYEAVYFVGLEDSAFWNFKNQPEADRSAFFVAISRAKRYMSFSYCEKRSNLVNYYNPSGDQKNDNINEFFDLLLQPGVATIVS